MRRFLLLVLPVLAVMQCQGQWNYPPTKTVDAADTYFGKTYPDPYRWLENLKDQEVQAWFKAQAKLADNVLAKIPGRDALVQEWTALDKLNPAAYSAIQYEHSRLFYKKTRGGENVARLFFAMAGMVPRSCSSIQPPIKPEWPRPSKTSFLRGTESLSL